jgi:hypothetical protein
MSSNHFGPTHRVTKDELIANVGAGLVWACILAVAAICLLGP